MNTKESIINAIKHFVNTMPQPNLESEAAQQMLSEHILCALEEQTPGTYNRDQLNFFTVFEGEEHK